MFLYIIIRYTNHIPKDKPMRYLPLFLIVCTSFNAFAQEIKEAETLPSSTEKYSKFTCNWGNGGKIFLVSDDLTTAGISIPKDAELLVEVIRFKERKGSEGKIRNFKEKKMFTQQLSAGKYVFNSGTDYEVYKFWKEHQTNLIIIIIVDKKRQQG